MVLLRSCGRFLVLLGLFAGATWELVRDRPSTRRERAAWLHRLCERAVRRLGMRVRAEGTFPERGCLICNHLGYLDIVAIAALHPCVFVAKAEIARWPFLGWFTTMAGTVFVERGRGGSATEVGARLRAAMEDGLPVVFFPEGTTSNGDGILPFHTGLLGETLRSAAGVTAGAIRYRLLEENAAGVTVQDDVAYWGDRAMLPHLFRFLGLRGIAVEVRFGDGSIAFSDGALTNRKVAGAEAQAAVAALR